MGHGHAKTELNPQDVRLPEGSLWRKLPVIGGVLGLAGLGATFALAGDDPKPVLLSYLTALMFFMSIGVGASFFVTIQYVTRAGWSVVVRRLMENLMAPLFLFIVLFIPILMNLDVIYKWTNPALQDPTSPYFDHLAVVKAPYLEETFFTIRSVFYLLALAAVGWFFYSRSTGQDQSGDKEVTRKLQFLSAPALMILALVSTFAAVDWMMTLDFHWFSTIFGVYWFAGSFLTALATTTLIGLALRSQGTLRNIITIEHYHDLGKLTFGFVVFWTYIAFSQYFLIWYANIPETTLWYGLRMDGTWSGVSVLLALGHFVIPFAFLMPRTIKRMPLTLGIGAAWLLAMHYVDMYWLIMPTAHPGGPTFGIVDVAALVGVGGLYFAVVGWAMARRALIPEKDPRLSESLAFENF